MPGEIGPYLKARPGVRQKARGAARASTTSPPQQSEWEAEGQAGGRAIRARTSSGTSWSPSSRAMVDNAAKMLLHRSGEAHAVSSRMRMTGCVPRNIGPDITKDKARDDAAERVARRSSRSSTPSLPPFTQAMAVAVDTTAPKTYIALGGDYRTKGAEVEPGRAGCADAVRARRTGCRSRTG